MLVAMMQLLQSDIHRKVCSQCSEFVLHVIRHWGFTSASIQYNHNSAPSVVAAAAAPSPSSLQSPVVSPRRSR